MALVFLRFFTANPQNFFQNLQAGILPKDEFYALRIFSADSVFSGLGNHYIDNKPYSYRNPEIISLAEISQRLFYKINQSEIEFSYYTFSLILLFFWIFLICGLVSRYSKASEFVLSSIVTIQLLLSFGQFRLVRGDYGFERLVSPQIHGLTWIMYLMMLVRTIELIRSGRVSQKFLFFYAISLSGIFLTYIFTFLIAAAVSAIVLLYLIFTKRTLIAVRLLGFSGLFVLPLVILTFKIREQERFAAASERMGLVEARLPSSLYSLVGALLLATTIFLFSRLYFRSSAINSLELGLIISCLGIVVATQSGIVTKRDIQFSSHFDVFLHLNWVIYSVYLMARFLNVPPRRATATRTFFARFSAFQNVTLVLIALAAISTLLISTQNSGKTNPFEKLSDRNVIVDDNVYQYSFPVFTSASILYNRSMHFYGFTDAELVERFIISKGCESDLTWEDLREVWMYSVDAPLQKANRLNGLSSSTRLVNLFAVEVQRLEEIARVREESQTNLLEKLIYKISQKDCISWARAYDVDRVVYSRNSTWVEIFTEIGLAREALPGTSLYVTSIAP